MSYGKVMTSRSGLGALRDTELISRKLANLRWILVASPAYIARRGRPETVEDLKSHACLRYVSSGRPWPFEFANGESLLPDGTVRYRR